MESSDLVLGVVAAKAGGGAFPWGSCGDQISIRNVFSSIPLHPVVSFHFVTL